jgi:hypothetical protein
VGRRKDQKRWAAAEAGLPSYKTTKPCRHGHMSLRFTVDGSCIECRKVFREGYRTEAKLYMREKRRRALSLDPEGTRAKWAAGNRARRVRDPEAVRELERKHGRIKRQRYPKRKLAEVRKRQADKLQRTPAWADLSAIRKFYEDCPVGFVVDHIIPLRGKFVSGLHVLENLQYLTPLANLEKGNRFDG